MTQVMQFLLKLFPVHAPLDNSGCLRSSFFVSHPIAASVRGIRRNWKEEVEKRPGEWPLISVSRPLATAGGGLGENRVEELGRPRKRIFFVESEHSFWRYRDEKFA